MTPPTQSQEPAGQQFPRLIVRPIAGSSELGFTVRHEYTPLEPKGVKMSLIADPKGEYWYGVARIDGIYDSAEKIAWANRIAAGCDALSTHSALLKRAQELEGLLKPFASLDISSADAQNHKDDRPVFGLNSTLFTVGDVRRARAALHQSAQGGKAL
jgi:hypothetical protein